LLLVDTAIALWLQYLALQSMQRLQEMEASCFLFMCAC
jgi:hypothetical protein